MFDKQNWSPRTNKKIDGSHA